MNFLSLNNGNLHIFAIDYNDLCIRLPKLDVLFHGKD